MGGTSTGSTLSGEQKAMLQPLVQHLLGIDKDGKKVGKNLITEGGATEYNKPIAAPVSSTWGTMNNELSGLIGQQNPQQQAMLNQQMQGNPAYKLDPTTTAQYYQQGLFAPAMKNFQQNIAPQIAEGYASPGGAFSSRAGDAQARALGNMQTNLNASLAQANQQNQGLSAQLAMQGQQQALAAGQQSMDLAKLPFGQAGVMGGLLQGQQSAKQQNLTTQYQAAQRMMPENNPYYQLVSQLLGNQQKYVRNDNTVQDATQIAGTAAGIAMML